MSISQRISGTLAAGWALAAPLSVGQMHFSVGWYDSEYQNYPQVTVRKAWSPEPLWFLPDTVAGLPDLNYISHDKYFIDCWYVVDRDILGEAEYDYVEDMMTECFRILNNKRWSFAGTTGPLGLVIPLDRGIAQHETNIQPRVLHIQMTCQANYKSGHA